MMQSGNCKIDSVVVVVDSAVAPGTGERVLVLLITRLRLLHQGGNLASAAFTTIGRREGQGHFPGCKFLPSVYPYSTV